MLKNYLKITVRNLRKHKLYSLINVLGLAIGMACSVLILLYVRDEVSYDRFNADAERIYRLTGRVSLPDQPIKDFSISPPPLAPALVNDFPEIEQAGRLLPYFEAALPGKAAVRYRENTFNDRFFWADGAILKIFTLPLLHGDRDTALTAPRSAVITESAAQKYFGDAADAVGKLLEIDSGYSKDAYKVTGVVRDLPVNSHLEFDVLGSISTLNDVKDERISLDGWWVFDCYTYVLLAEGAAPEAVEEKIGPFLRKYMGESAQWMTFFMQPLTDIHLRSHLLNEIKPNSDIAYVYILTAVASLTLLIACINFMNLSTARSAGRAKEVGLRKVVGAHREQLIWQFLGESLLMSFIALALAIVLVLLTLPVFNAYTGKDMALGYGLSTWLGLLGIGLLVGVLAGSYPAFFLSSFRPLKVLRGAVAAGPRSALLRKALVVFQFTVSVILIIGTFVIHRQLSYMRNSELGFDKERMIVVPVRDFSLRDRYAAVKDELARHSNVLGTGLSALVIGNEAPNIAVQPLGAREWQLMGALVVDQDFIDTFGIEVIAGRNFANGNPGDISSAFILNESAAQALGWSAEEAVGQQLNWGGVKQGEVVGVVRDFHYQPLKFKIYPLVLHIRPIAFHYLSIKIGAGDLEQTLEELRAGWRKIFPQQPFDYFFMDEEFDRLYRAEEQLGRTFGFFALVAIFVGCLGLLGLAAFTAEQRTKEVGIRKAMGATVGNIVVLLSGEFTRLVLLATLIAWPVAYALTELWLRGFAYRVHPGFASFLLGGAIALAVAWLTVAFQSIRAALTQPAVALRYE